MAQIDASIPLSVKQFQAPSLTDAATNALTMAEVGQQFQSMRDDNTIQAALKAVDPNDPKYSEKDASGNPVHDYDKDVDHAISSSGASPKSILQFRKEELAADRAKTEAENAKLDTQNKILEHTLQIEKLGDTAIDHALKVNGAYNNTLSDVIKTYDDTTGNKPTAASTAAASAKAKVVRDTHIDTLLQQGIFGDPKSKQAQAQADNYKKQPFSIDQIRSQFDNSEYSHNVLDQAKTRSEIAKNQAEALKFAREQPDKYQVVQTVDPDTKKSTWSVIDKNTGKIVDTDAEAAQKPTQGAGGRAAVMSQRMINAASEVKAGLSALTGLKGTADSGLTTGTNLIFHGDVKSPSALGNTVASQDVQLYNTRIAGVARNLATLETSGLAPQGSLTQGLGDSITLKPGDSQLTKLDKFAEIRQIVEANIDSQVTSPNLTQEQKDFLQGIKSDIQKSIPFTHDKVDFLRDNEKSGKTFNQLEQEYNKKAGGNNISSSSSTLTPDEQKKQDAEFGGEFRRAQ